MTPDSALDFSQSSPHDLPFLKTFIYHFMYLFMYPHEMDSLCMVWNAMSFNKIMGFSMVCSELVELIIDRYLKKLKQQATPPLNILTAAEIYMFAKVVWTVSFLCYENIPKSLTERRESHLLDFQNPYS